MIEALFHARIRPVVRRQRRLQLWRKLAVCWGVCAAVVFALAAMQRATGFGSPFLLPVLGGLSALATLVILIRHWRTPVDVRAAVREIEQRHPELEGLVLTAYEQLEQGKTPLTYLQQRVVHQAVEKGLREDWRQTVPTGRFLVAHGAQLAALALLGLALLSVRIPFKPGVAGVFVTRVSGLEVAPGDVSLERGSSLVVLARFGDDAPESAELLIQSPGANPRRLPLVRSLNDPVFGVTVPDVAAAFTYRVEYARKATRDYKVGVFEYPRLERADAEIQFPAYTALPPKRIEDTRRATAVEGSRLDFALQLNKPVVSATLVARGGKAPNITLTIATNRAAASLDQFMLTNSASYDLRLVDADGRTNKTPALFVFDAQPNRPPELKLIAPRGDARPSALEELTFDGTAWDDFGLVAYGLAFTMPDGTTESLELGRSVPAKETRPLKHMLRLEDIGAKPDQLLSWFVWAEDIGPDGEVRRTSGDLFFGEVRPFEEIFREGEGMGGGGEQGGEQGGDGSPTTKLAELQKQIINATWKLQRQHSGKKPDDASPKGDSTKPATDGKKPTSAILPKHGSPLHSELMMEVSPPSPRPSPPGRGGTLARLVSSSPTGLRHIPVFARPTKRSPDPASAWSPSASVGFSLSPGEMAGVRAGNSHVVSRQTIFGQRSQPEDSGERTRPRRSESAERLQSLVETKGAGKPATPGTYEADIGVVYEAMTEALDLAESSRDRQQDPRIASLWADTIQKMESSLKKLDDARKAPAKLPEALTAEKAAYQALLKVREREFQVTRGRNQSQRGSGAGEQAMQRQLEQLDLTQEENRYETQRQAQSPQNPERREQLQVMNRLQELARRQEDLNERLKELQSALKAADTEKEQEEIRRQLKRLQEEQQQMLADTDELQQRMERPENQSRMAEQRQQLEQTRNDMQRASEAAAAGQAAQAAAAGTRAQRQLQQMREDLRKQNSSEFSEDLRQMRAEARDLARQQEEITRKLGELNNPQQRQLDDSAERKKLLDQLAQQERRLTNVVDKATQISQAAESSEALASRQLYDSLRKLSQDDAQAFKQTREELVERGMLTRKLYEQLEQTAGQESGKAVAATADILREGFVPAAEQASRRPQAPVEDLRRGIERAAESVLGDDAEALRLADQELDRLTQQLEREMAQAGIAPAQNQQSQSGAAQPGGRQPGSSTNQVGGQLAQAGGQPGGERQPGEQPGQDSQQQSQDGQPQDRQPQSGRGQQGRGQQTANAGNQPGQAQANGDQPQPSEQPGQGGQGGQGGQQAQQGQAGNRGQGQRGNRQQQQANRSQQNGGQQGGPGEFNLDNLENLLGGPRTDGGGRGGGPILGEDFAQWSDGLRDVEEVLEQSDLRSGVSIAREQARLMRLEFKRDLKKPDWANVQLKIVKPLVEVRERIREELARRTPEDSLVPIDRDPVPGRYSELVRRYYEELGKDK